MEENPPPADRVPDPAAKPRILVDLDESRTLRDRVVAMLKTVYDPEIPVDIYELGLIYDIALDEEARKAAIRMTLTSPGCPVAGTLPGEVKARVEEVDGIDEATIELVWDPPWSRDNLSEEARLTLGLV